LEAGIELNSKVAGARSALRSPAKNSTVAAMTRMAWCAIVELPGMEGATLSTAAWFWLASFAQRS
jgi:hypothetical protein